MKINDLFNQNKEGLLNIFFTAGYPKLNSTVQIAQALDKSGVKIVEIGMPYSDPLADGETIQDSSKVALNNGINVDIMFSQIQSISETTNLTIILMGYLNQFLALGVEHFLSLSQSVGIKGMIIPDLPMDIYEEKYKKLFEKYEIAISFLVTPRTSIERVKEANRLSTGFLYLVADNSITGGDSGEFSSEQIAYFQRIKDFNLSSPSLIGFGVKTAEQFALAKKYANGAIIGSKFIRKLSTMNTINVEGIKEFVSSIANN